MRLSWRKDVSRRPAAGTASGSVEGARARLRRVRVVRCMIGMGIIAAALAAGARTAGAAGDISTGTQSGLPVPRFVSLKSDRVNVRAGPTKDHDVTWVYTRAGLPVEITAEFENWRRIRDWEGAEGWVYHSLLSGRRTVFVAKTKSGEELAAVRASADADAPIKAKLEPGVLATVKRCSGSWCHISGESFDGWVRQERLWGVYPDEKID